MQIGQSAGQLGPALLNLLQGASTARPQAAAPDTARAAADPKPTVRLEAAQAAVESGRTYARGSFLDIQV